MGRRERARVSSSADEKKVARFLALLGEALSEGFRGRVSQSTIDSVMRAFRRLGIVDIAFVLLPTGRLPRVHLSPRLFEVARLRASGLTVPRIAKVLRLKGHTAKKYVDTVYRRVGVHSHAELILYFVLHHAEVFLPKTTRSSGGGSKG